MIGISLKQKVDNAKESIIGENLHFLNRRRVDKPTTMCYEGFITIKHNQKNLRHNLYELLE